MSSSGRRPSIAVAPSSALEIDHFPILVVFLGFTLKLGGAKVDEIPGMGHMGLL